MLTLDTIKQKASGCTQCELYNNKVTNVFSKGNPEADILICGMCPGPDENSIENIQGFPFVGKAGRFLDVLIEESGLSLDSVYITNIVKCFVKPGISLQESWVVPCVSYFICELFIVRPKVIIALGKDVAFNLSSTLRPNANMTEIRSTVRTYMNIPVVPTYHPSYYIRAGGKSHKDFYKGIEDFAKAKRIATEAVHN